VARALLKKVLQS